MGVTVVIKDKKVGVQTDFDGVFEINADLEDTLIFNYVGMQKKEVVVRSIDLSSDFEVILEDDENILDEVVITGYQKKDEKTLTGSVVKVDMKRIQNRPTARVQDLLAGIAPGLLVTRSNPGRVGGGGTSITSQGGGFRGSGNMLIVLDGLPQSGDFFLESINPQDIESINVLRDSEAVIYGSRASNGVIVVTTKTGKNGKHKISVRSNVMIKMPNIVFKAQNIVEYVRAMEEGWNLQKISPTLGYPKLIKYLNDNNITSETLEENNKKPLAEVPFLKGVPFPDVYGVHMFDFDWNKLFYGPAIDHQNNITFSGGVKEKGIKYYANIGNTRENSLMKYGKNHQNNLFGNAKLELQLKKWIKLGVNINTSFIKNTSPSQIGNAETFLTSRPNNWTAPFNLDGNPIRWGGYRSPISYARDGGEATIRANRFQGQAYAVITPLKNLNINLTAQQSYYSMKSLTGIKKAYDYVWDTKKPKQAINAQTSVSRSNTFNRFFNGTATIDYKFKLGDIHDFGLFGLYSHEEFDYSTTSSRRVNRLTESITSLNLTSSKDQNTSDSMVQETITGLSFNFRYTLLGRYTLEANVRQDGSSRFAKGFKYATFSGVGLAYSLSDENFFKNAVPKNIVSKVKLRFTQGVMANRNGVGLYDYAQNVNINNSGVLLGALGTSVKAQQAYLSGPSSENRTWVKINKRNFGFDLGFINDKLALRADIYKATTDNGFYSKEVPTSFGAAMPQINGAKYENNGWDLQVKWSDNIKDFSYGISAGLSDNVNKVVSLPDSRIIRYGTNSWVEGEEVNSTYGFKFEGLMKSQEQVDAYKAAFTAGIPTRSDFGVGDAMYKDMDGNGKLEFRPYKLGEDGKPTDDSGDLIRLKNTNPHYYYFINLDASYKNWSFSMVLNGIGSWYVYDTTRQSNYAYPWVTRDKYTYKIQYHPTNNPNSNIPRFYAAESNWDTTIARWNYRVSDGAHVMKNVDLDLSPKDRVTKKQFFKSVVDFKIYATNFYGDLPSFGRMGEDNWTDICFGNANGISNSQRQPSPTSGTWNGGYARVRKYLELVEAANKPDGKKLGNSIDPYVGEAHFFIAQAYFNLYRFFGAVPLVTKVLTPEDDLYPEKAKREEVVNYILSNLDKAIAKLPETVAAADGGRLVKNAARAYKARITLFAGTWRKYHGLSGANDMLDQAIAESKAVMDSGKYSLFKNSKVKKGANFDPVANFNYLFSLENYTPNNPWNLNKTNNNEFILTNRHHREERRASNTVPSSSNSYTHSFVSQILDDNGLPIQNARSVFQTDKANHDYGLKIVTDAKGRKVANNLEFNNRDPRMAAMMAKPLSQIWLQRHSYNRNFEKARKKMDGKEDAEKGTGFMFFQFFESPTGYLNIKFNVEGRSAKGEDGVIGVDFPVIRLAEVLLIYAEAKFEKNGNISDGDLDLSINLLRDRVEMPKLTNAFVTTNGLDMKTEIRRERMVELATEGFRYDDIRRWKIAETVLPQAIKGVKWKNNPMSKKFTYFDYLQWKEVKDKAAITKAEPQDADGFLILENANARKGFDPAKHYLWPIPLDEISKYKKNGKTLEQNPGW
uniref:TonB-dependent receptor SusC n=1 Tax=Stylophora pistillata TaxID=50429 RepID=A0A2B4RFN2_STYPI